MEKIHQGKIKNNFRTVYKNKNATDKQNYCAYFRGCYSEQTKLPENTLKRTNFEDDYIFEIYLILCCCLVIMWHRKYFLLLLLIHFFFNRCHVIHRNMLSSPDHTEWLIVFTNQCFTVCTGIFSVACQKSEERTGHLR